ncbi:DUF2779 domain-containing protein [Treponema primitia]|uniref:DUF2779 domain-containing protein n=1 Tax=Treponema primitia TaxID=88058 RepID=UPI000255580D|nr:DUF2779 domain-containing protein [Treponema primitia]
MNLSKSRYCQGLQCPKILWMKENKPDEYNDEVMNEAILKTGNEVGDLAMGYFGEFAEVAYNADKSRMISDTEKLLAEGHTVLCEASFSYKGNFCSVDILRKFKNAVEIVEVKSSTEIKPVYIDDMAFQYYVLSGCGLGVKKISLMHINNRYVRQGNLDLKKLFTIEDCTPEVIAKQKDMEKQIADIKLIAGQKQEPVIGIGPHCGDPYLCGYTDYCWRHIPDKSVFTIARLPGKKKFDYYDRGIISFDDILKSGVSLSEKQQRQLESEAKQLPPRIDTEKIRAFLDTLSCPLYFLDFETFMPALPPFDGCRPYMQIPFQYSLHILKSPAAELEHREFLAQEGTDPRRPLAEALCKDIPRTVCTLAYNMGFEKMVIANLAELFPDLSKQLLAIRRHIKDLMTPFQSHAYYRREFEGSYSIKAVLPALFPDDPELDYHGLDLIQNGGDAMNAFLGLEKKESREIAAIRQALIAYCRLDTLAMVKIWEYLKSLV